MGKERDRGPGWRTGGKTVLLDGSPIEDTTGSRRKTAYLTVIRGADHDLGNHAFARHDHGGDRRGLGATALG